MRLPTLLLLFAFCSLSLQAQITITSSSMPAAGDTIRYSISDSLTPIGVTATGPDFYWDFYPIAPLLQDVAQYKRAIDVNAAYLLFFGATGFGRQILDSITLEDLYAFYKTTTSAFTSEGAGLTYRGIPIPASYSDEDEIFQFPLSFGDRDSSTYRVSFTLSDSLRYVQSGYRINEVDGWGKLVLPIDTFQCLRVKSSLYRTDSIVINGFALPAIKSVQVSYLWLGDTEKIPLVQIDGVLRQGDFYPTSVRYRDNYQKCLNEVPSPDFSTPTPLAAVGDTISLINITTCGSSIYNWFITPNTGYSYTNGTSFLSANPTLSFTTEGTYSVKLVAYNLAGVDSLVRTNYLTISTVTDEDKPLIISDEVFLKVYPSPATDLVQVAIAESFVRTADPKEQVQLLTLAGAEIATQAPQRGTASFSVADLAPGIYLIRFGTQQVKFLKQ